jgi:hypothetical protein
MEVVPSSVENVVLYERVPEPRVQRLRRSTSAGCPSWRRQIACKQRRIRRRRLEKIWCVCVCVWRGYLVDDLVLQTSVDVFVGVWAVWELTRHVC